MSDEKPATDLTKLVHRLRDVDALAAQAIEAQTQLATQVAEMSGVDDVHLDLRSIHDLHRSAQHLVIEALICDHRSKTDSNIWVGA